LPSLPLRHLVNRFLTKKYAVSCQPFFPEIPQTLQKKSLFAKPDLKKTVSGGILINRQFVL
jgi:hypothetical protein